MLKRENTISIEGPAGVLEGLHFDQPDARGLALIVSSPLAGPTGAPRRAVRGAQRNAQAIGILTRLAGVQYEE